MKDHKLIIRVWKTKETEVVIEEYTSVFGDKSYPFQYNLSNYFVSFS